MLTNKNNNNNTIIVTILVSPINNVLIISSERSRTQYNTKHLTNGTINEQYINTLRERFFRVFEHTEYILHVIYFIYIFAFNEKQ